MNRRAVLAFLLTAAMFLSPTGRALADTSETMPADTVSPDTGIDHLRAAMESAYSAGDVDTLVKYIHPDAVIIFPDGTILKGPQELRAYIQHMTKDPDHIVASFSANPVVQSRTIHGDVALSYGLMNDHYQLTSGKQFDLNSRFTITLFKSPTGPADSDGWMIRSFHSSTDAFDNPILAMAAQKVLIWAGGGGVLVGILIAAIVGQIFKTRKPKPQPA